MQYQVLKYISSCNSIPTPTLGGMDPTPHFSNEPTAAQIVDVTCTAFKKLSWDFTSDLGLLFTPRRCAAPSVFISWMSWMDGWL